MLIKNNDESILNEYFDYLADKGKILSIRDTNCETNIKFSSGIIYYFLLIVSIALILLTVYLANIFLISPSPDDEGSAIIVIGVALLTIIVIGVTFNERKYLKLNITYPSDNEIKVNNKVFNINRDSCYINITKKFEYNPVLDNNRGIPITPDSHIVKYFLVIRGNNFSKSFQITNGTEEQLKELIYNFEYEISDFEKDKNEFIKNAQNTLEELYDKGKVSQDSIQKLYDNINKEK